MEEKEIHLRDYLRIIAKRKAAVVTFFLITVIVVTIKTYSQTPMYVAAAHVMIEKNTAGALTDYRYMGYDPEFLETQYQLISSAAVAEKVVDSLGANKIYDAFFAISDKKKEDAPSLIHIAKTWVKNQLKGVKEWLKFAQPGRSGKENESLIPPEFDVPLSKTEQLILGIKSGIIAEPIGNSRVVSISFWSHNPVVAMQVVNSVADAYISELLDMQMEVSGYSISWMRDKAESQRKKLEQSEKELHAYKKKHDIITVENRLAVLPERLAEFSSKLAMAEAKRKQLYAAYQQVRNAKKEKLEAIPAIAGSTSIDDVKKKILQAEQKISELSKKYGPKHPKMISAKNELKSLVQSKYNELENAAQTIKNEYELARSNVRDLNELLDQAKFESSRFGEQSIQLNILQRKVDTNRYLYDALVTKMKEKGITEKNQSVNVWVIEKAQLPKMPAKPNKRRNILLGIILGLFGGIGLVFFFEYLDNTIKTPEDIEEKYGTPVLSAIDLFDDKKKTLLQDIIENPSSLNSENFKGLRTALLLSAAESPPKIVLVTSMTPGEGKSSISSCMAATMAQVGQKVLLIDADMRRPTLHKQFNIPNIYGLSSLLAGISKPDDQQALYHPLKQLDVLSSGPVPPNPAELLSSPRFSSILDQFVKKYDMIIIDTPPIASVTDPVLLSKKVEGVIIVTWAGKTTYEIFNKGLKQLKDVSAPITGVVLNRFNAKKSGYYYNYGDYYYSSETS